VSDPTPAPAPDDEGVPLFGSWPRIYAAVLIAAVLSMGAIALFSRWPY
jgi:hypothetical protein